jgi:sulfate transporter 4
MQFVADLQIHALPPINEVKIAEVENRRIYVPHMPSEKADRVLSRFQRRQKERSIAYKAAKQAKCGIVGSDMDALDQDQKQSTFGKYFTIFDWAKRLTKDVVKADVIAGVTVGVMAVPQSMSYANIAGLPFMIGLYSAATPTFVYALMGTSRQLAVGPVAMVSLLLEAGLRGLLDEEQCPAYFDPALNPAGLAQSELCPDEYSKLAFLTCFVAGMIQVVAAIFNLGFLASFLGHPVVSGFTSGAAIIIGLSQFKYVLGYDIEKSQYIHETLGATISQLDQTNFVNLALGFGWILALMGMKSKSKSDKRFALLGPLGPLIMCTIGVIVMGSFPTLHDDYHIKYVGALESDITSLVSSHLINFQDFQKVFPTAISVSLIGFMESVAIGKSLAAKHGYELDPTQEMLALGITNIVGSGFSCYPSTGSFSRSAVNNQVGAQSQLAGVVTSAVLFLTIIALTSFFYYLPLFALAAIVISSVIPLVAVKEGYHLWKVSRKDGFLWLFAFFGTLFLGVLLGMASAVGMSLVILIHESVHPQIALLWRLPGTEIYRNVKQESTGEFVEGVLTVRVGAALYFANASLVKDRLLQYVADMSAIESVHYLVIEMTPVSNIDATAVHVIDDMVSDFRIRNVHVALTSLSSRVQKLMRRSGLYEKMGKEWIFDRVHDAVLYCLQHQDAMRKQGKNGHVAQIEDAKRGTVYEDQVVENEGNRFILSNMMDPKCTVAEVHMRKAWPTLLSDILAILQTSDVFIAKCEAESNGPFQSSALKFWLRSASSSRKLSREQLDHVQSRVRNMWRSRSGSDDELVRRGSETDLAGQARDLAGSPDMSDVDNMSQASSKVETTPVKQGVQPMWHAGHGANAMAWQVPPNGLAPWQVPGNGMAGMTPFVVPAGAVVMMPSGMIPYATRPAGSEPEPASEPGGDAEQAMIAL